MAFAWIKSYAPRSLFARTTLILLVPIVTIQLVVSYVFIQRLYQNVTEQMTASMALDVAYLAGLIDAAEDAGAARRAVAPAARELGVSVLFSGAPPETDARLFYDVSGRVVTEVLRRMVPAIGAVDLASDDKRVRLSIASPHGVVEMRFARTRVSASNPHQLLVLMVAVSLVVTLVSFLFLKNQVRPIRRLAEAADAFGKGRHLAYRPSGATEVRSAGAAFLEMRGRIERHIEQRTLLLSGVSHDLRTPLTRLKLALSMMPENGETRELLGDVAEMERMIESFLGFAQLDATEKPEPVDPVVLANRVVENARRGGGTVELASVSGQGRVPIRPMAVERALENLVANGLRYGTRVRIGVSVTERALRFRVEDDGPGIPEALREEAMKPFSRLDTSRNQNRGGGVGLGLAIVRDVARQHGGTLRLGESEDLGGLRAELVIAR